MIPPENNTKGTRGSVRTKSSVRDNYAIFVSKNSIRSRVLLFSPLSSILRFTISFLSNFPNVSSTFLSLSLYLSILFLHSLLRILSSFRRSKSKSMHASLASRHSCPYVEINCPVIIALAVSVRSLSIFSQPWLDAKSNRRHTSSNHARFISVFTGLRLVAKSLLHLHGAYRIVCLGKLKREKFAKDRVSKKRLRFVKNNQSTRAFRISLVCQIRSNYRNSMQRDNTPMEFSERSILIFLY